MSISQASRGLAPLPLFRRPRQGPAQVVGVDDPVRVAVLGQKPLPVRGVIGVQGVSRDDRTEVRLTPVALGPQQPSEPPRFLLTRPEGARHLNGDSRFRQVDGEVRG